MEIQTFSNNRCFDYLKSKSDKYEKDLILLSQLLKADPDDEGQIVNGSCLKLKL